MAAANGSINARAQSGFANSTQYDAHRPAYSPTIVQFILEKLGVAGQKGARIVDLAAGTGKFTEALAARDEQYQVIAVEPHSGMRDVLVAKNLPRVTVVDGTGESMPSIESGIVDAVIVAQAFHWFANMEALKEIHRVLRRHSALGLVWNAEDYNSPRDHKASTEWEGKLQDLMSEVEEQSGDKEPRFRHLEWRKVFDQQVKKTPLSLIRADNDPLFSLPIGEHQEPFEVTLTPEAAWARFRTLGHIAVLEGEQLVRVKKAFTDAINGPDVEKNERGEVVLHGSTYAVWTTKIPEEGREGIANGPEAEPVES